MEREAVFEEHRRHLFGVAYRMLGAVADAEDAVQETFLRWRDVGDDVESPRAYLTTVVTRLCIDQLKSARARREEYFGTWLPEPVITEGPLSADAAAELADSLSVAFLVLLESLSPVERAAFLLREVFDYEYAEVAAILGKSEAACRQLVSRAREHVAARRPRYGASAERRAELTGRFVAACETGDMQGLLDILAEDITLYSDGGGKVRAATRPVFGADRVARFLLGILKKAPEGLEMRHTEINGEPGFVTSFDGRTIAAMTLHVVDDRIEGIYIVNNPDKLTAIVGGA
jgi:RNA polymerase sigma-70 factor (ECF subfamily)